MAREKCQADGQRPARRAAGIMSGFRNQNTDHGMEAEQLNSISNQLDDLAQRAAELRRYL
jgi:hypothetical protein